MINIDEWLKNYYKEHYHSCQAQLQVRHQLIRGLLAVIIVLALVIAATQVISNKELEEQAKSHTEFIAEYEKKMNSLKDTIKAKESIIKAKDEELFQKSLKPEPQTFVDAEALGEYTITYYCPCEECSDQWGSQTSTGATAQEGVTIAVDPTVIPYGSLIYIEGIGYRIAQDCGGLIKGNRIDVYMNSHQETVEHGIHKANIYMITGGIENEKK